MRCLRKAYHCSPTAAEPCRLPRPVLLPMKRCGENGARSIFDVKALAAFHRGLSDAMSFPPLHQIKIAARTNFEGCKR